MKRRPSPALVVACIALLVALGGTSYATVLNVPRNSVGTPQLKRNAVKPAKLAPGAVRTAHVLNGSLLAADFKAGQLPTGSKGDKGDPGPAGNPGVSGLERVTATSPTNSNGVKGLNVTCPGGKRVVGGGGSLSGGGSNVALHATGPHANGVEWGAAGREVNATAESWSVTVYALCANVP